VPVPFFFGLIGLLAFFYDVPDEPQEVEYHIEDNHEGDKLEEVVIHVRHSLIEIDRADRSIVFGGVVGSCLPAPLRIASFAPAVRPTLFDILAAVRRAGCRRACFFDETKGKR
jgi:hypothetical protein